MTFDLSSILRQASLMISDLKHPDTLMTRHAAQDLLHHAIHLKGSYCEGVLIGIQGKIEHHLPYNGTHESKSTPLAQQKNIMGLYRSYAEQDANICIQDVLETVQRIGLNHVPSLFIAVILATKGRVENIAFYIKNNELFPLKLTMQEDGHMQMKAQT